MSHPPIERRVSYKCAGPGCDRWLLGYHNRPCPKCGFVNQFREACK